MRLLLVLRLVHLKHIFFWGFLCFLFLWHFLEDITEKKIKESELNFERNELELSKKKTIILLKLKN